MGGFSRKSSAVNTSTSSAGAKNRLNKRPQLDAYDPSEPTIIGSVLSGDEKLKMLAKAASAKAPTSSAYGQKIWKNTLPLNYKWNLPPHNWSLPTEAITVDTVTNQRQPIVNPKALFFQDGKARHSLRRGRVWFFDVAGVVEDVDAEGKVAAVGGGASVAESERVEKFDTDRQWGFQFLWNPESISSSVSRNMDITPSSADSLRVVSGAFPGQEQFQISIMIDRVNDFACARGMGVEINSNNTVVSTPSLERFKSFYTSGSYPGDDSSITFVEKMSYLMAQGTMADVEYLFKAINGTFKNSNAEWSNLLGKRTANIGYLQPSLMAFQFGPTLDSLAWVGWITSLSLNHTMFTQNMVPIRTELSFSVDAFTGSGVSSK